jgi:hypothetical protein
VRRTLINLSQCLKYLSQYLTISYDGVIPDYTELLLLLKRAFIDRRVLPPFEAEFFDPLKPSDDLKAGCTGCSRIAIVLAACPNSLWLLASDVKSGFSEMSSLSSVCLT